MNVCGCKFKSSLLFCNYNFKKYFYKKILLVCVRIHVEIRCDRIRSVERRESSCRDS